MTRHAALFGVTALDEVGVCMAGRHQGRTYAPDKPDQFCFQFYAKASSSSLYVGQFQINNRGVSPKKGTTEYVHQHLMCRHALEKVLKWLKDQDQKTEFEDASMLWTGII